MTRYQVFLHVRVAATTIWVGGATAYALVIGVMEPPSTPIRHARTSARRPRPVPALDAA